MKPQAAVVHLAALLAAALFAGAGSAAQPAAHPAPAPVLGLPPLPPPGQTPARIELGRMLFMDRRLARNNTLSCAMCHVPEQGFTSLTGDQVARLAAEARAAQRDAVPAGAYGSGR